jgi:predicted nucleotidyltransferase
MERMIAFIRRVVEIRYPDALGVLFFGSHSKGTSNAKSDIDIILFKENLPQAVRELYEVDDWLLDIQIFSYELYLKALNAAWQARQSYYGEVLRTGLIVRDDDGRLAQLRAQLDAVMKKSRSDFDWRRMRFSIICLLNDAACAKDDLDRIAVSSELFRFLTVAYVLKHSGELHSARRTNREMATIDGEFAREFINSYRKSIDGDSGQFIAMARVILDEIGGPITRGELVPLQFQQSP